jgi:regulatory protein
MGDEDRVELRPVSLARHAPETPASSTPEQKGRQVQPPLEDDGGDFYLTSAKPAKKKAAPRSGGRADPRAPRTSKPLTAQRIRNIAEAYVSARECSEQMLRSVLQRRLARRLASIASDEVEKEKAATTLLIEAEVERLVGAGIISDERFAQMKARSALSSGKGVRRISMDLSQKGISQEGIRDALVEASRETTGIYRDDVCEAEIVEGAEEEAADRFARKKRIGRHRVKPLPEDIKERMKAWRREAGAMARAGFSVDLIRRTLDQEPEADE